MAGTDRSGVGDAATRTAPAAPASTRRLFFGDDEAAQRRMRGQ